MMYSEEEYYQKADNLIRISCQAVQGVFRDSWKRLTGSEWVETSAKDFIKGDGRWFYSNCKSIQRQLLEKGNVEEWDLTLLSGIFSSNCFKSRDDDSWKQKKAALQKLCNERNQLAHKVTKKINSTAYKQVEDTVKQSLLALGMEKVKIEKWVSHAGVTSCVGAWDQANQIQKLGDKEFSKGKFQKAIQHYDEALFVPSLLPTNLSTLYEQRAAAYLELGNKETKHSIKNSLYSQAMADITEALNNNDNSWKAHSILARIHKERNEMEEAITHFTRALAICPAQTKLKEELNNCKLIRGAMIREDHLDPTMHPRTIAELAEQFSQKTGLNITAESVGKSLINRKEIFPGDRDVAKGHQFENGWDVTQSFSEAARYYAKGMNKGNAEGAYQLALLYLDGKGVRKDIAYAIELLKSAANRPESEKIRGKLEKNHVVPFAQNALGLKYHEGVGVEQDFKEAAKWYTKAAEAGVDQAINNLAILYYHGKGVTKSLKMAEMYWKKSAECGNAGAAQSLCTFYIDELEPDLATFWLEKAIALGQNRLSFQKEDFMKRINESRKMRESWEDGVNKFEQKHGLAKQGINFGQRIQRMEVARLYQTTKEAEQAKGSSSDAAEKEATECAEQLGKILDSDQIRSGGKIDLGRKTSKLGSAGMHRFVEKANLEIIEQRAEEGSLIAKRMMMVYEYNIRLLQLWKDSPAFPKEKAEDIIDLIYKICCLEHHLLLLNSMEMDSALKKFLQSQFETHCNKKGEMDKKVRLCYALFGNDKGQEFAIEVLKESCRRYPDELIYYYLLGCFHAAEKKFIEGLEIANKGLERFPNAVDLLFCRAFHTHMKGNEDHRKEASTEDKVQAYLDFIRAAPVDHRQVPEAYYTVAQIYFCDSNESGDDASVKMLEYYEKGKRAEAHQLPCYLPYESSNKAVIMAIVKSIQSSTPKDEAVEVKNLPNVLTNPKRDYLNDPKRIEVRKDHRFQHKRTSQVMSNFNYSAAISISPSLDQKLPKRLAGLKEITLKEMDPMQDKIYEHKIINLTLIEDPLMFYSGIHMVAMDDNKDTIRFSVYNLPHNEEVREALAFGRRLCIMNPYLRIAMDRKNGIRVDDPKSIFYMEKVENMCRYCCEENAPHKCSKCMWAKYCSRECQKKDWKQLDHKLVCKPY